MEGASSRPEEKNQVRIKNVRGEERIPPSKKLAERAIQVKKRTLRPVKTVTNATWSVCSRQPPN